MNRLKKCCATLTLILALSGLVSAGEIEAPPVVAPTPPPPRVSTTAELDASALGSSFDVTLDLVLSILSIF